MQFQKEIQEAMKLLPDDQYSAIAQQELEKQLQQAHDTVSYTHLSQVFLSIVSR